MDKKTLHSGLFGAFSCKELEERISSCEGNVCVEESPYGNKYLWLSALQKSIRRGREEEALKAALLLLEREPKILGNRLAVITFEDLGVADIPLLQEIVEALTFKEELSEKYGAEKLAHYLVKRMCEAVKDRTITNLYDIGANPQTTIPIPPEITALVKQGRKLTKHGFVKFLPLAWEMKERSKEKYVLENRKLPASPLVNGWSAETYCMYTREGKRCLRYFAKSCQPISSFFATRTEANKIEALGHALFHTDGALLNKRLMFGGSELYLKAAYADLAKFGLSENDALSLMALVRKNMPELNYVRQKLLSIPSDHHQLTEIKK